MRAGFRRWFTVGSCVFTALGVAACAAGDQPASALSCTRVSNLGPDDDVSATLARAESGECVVLRAGTYDGPFKVGAGVKLSASEGAEVTLLAREGTAPVVTVTGGAGSGLYGVTVRDAPAIGIAIEEGGAELVGVKVLGAAKTGLFVRCQGRDCLSDGSRVSVTDAEVRQAAVGVWALGARLVLTRSEVRESHALSLASGYGVVASGGANVELSDTIVEGNEDVGVLVDGLGGTQLTLTTATVRTNRGRGIWAQGLLGSETQARLQIEGSTIEGNRIAGVGARESKGIIIINSRVADTAAVSLPTEDLGRLEDVGDGIGLFAATGAVRLDGVVLENNARAQGLIDRGDKGIIIINSRVAGTAKSVVVQRTTEQVEAPAELVNPPLAEPLGISAPSFAIARD